MLNQPLDQGYHYGVIARALQLIDEAGRPGLTLDELARRLSMSPAHFQRVFSRWVGVSPKRYQQYLTIDLAKRLLAERHTLLDTAAESGLSGSGRLHDLFLRWEAMSPGEYARAGEGLKVRYGWFASPFGEVLAMGTGRGLCGLAFSEGCGREAAYADLTGRWPGATFTEDPEPLAPWVEAAFEQKGEARLHLIGAPFQIKVWGGPALDPLGRSHDLFRHRPHDRQSPRRARRRNRRRPQSRKLAHPLPPRAQEIRRARRLSLGLAGEAGHAGLRGRPRRRGQRLNRKPMRENLPEPELCAGVIA